MSDQQHIGNSLSVKDWDEKYWKSGSKNPPFHVSSPHKTLVKHYEQIFIDDSKKRVLIPLCGKSQDMIYLSERRHEVVGVEYSEIAVQSFYEENNLPYTKETSGRFVMWRSTDPSKIITIFQGDFYDVNQETLGLFDIVWDRGSFTAINLNDREAYTSIMFTLMKMSTRYLTQVCEYDGSLYGGPPHSVTERAMKNTFGRKCSFEKLETIEVNAPSIAAGIDWKVSIYLVQLIKA